MVAGAAPAVAAAAIRRVTRGAAASGSTRGPTRTTCVASCETALAEDLRYGHDATTAATVPADAVAVAEFTARAPGVLAGLPAARAVLDAVLGVDGYTVLTARADGDRLAAGDVALAVRAPVRGLLTAERTALNLALPPLRRRDRDRELGWTPSKAPAPASATPARPSPACGCWRSTPCAAAAGSTTGSASATPC